MFYVYIHCRPDGTAFYVGKGSYIARSRDFNKRNRHHKSVVSKYGKENIQTVIIPCSSEDVAFSWEIQLIKSFREMGYRLTNISDGGEGATGVAQSTISRERKSEAMKGRKFSEEHRRKLSTAHKNNGLMPPSTRGISLSENHRAKISAALKARSKGRLA